MANGNGKMNQTDHDLLIRLDEKFETFTKQYHLDMKSLNDGMTKQITKNAIQLEDHEKRLDTVERIIDVVKPEETYNDYITFKTEIKNIILKAGTIASFSRILAGIFGGAIMWLLIQLPQIIENWNLFK